MRLSLACAMENVLDVEILRLPFQFPLPNRGGPAQSPRKHKVRWTALLAANLRNSSNRLYYRQSAEGDPPPRCLPGLPERRVAFPHDRDLKRRSHEESNPLPRLLPAWRGKPKRVGVAVFG